MADPKRQASWERTRVLLEASRGLLPDPEGVGLQDAFGYFDALDRNELGLAFDLLVEVGASQRAPRPFWDRLQEASDEISLSGDHNVHSRSVRTLREWITKEDL